MNKKTKDKKNEKIEKGKDVHKYTQYTSTRTVCTLIYILLD